jgi:hypothetical protein
MPECQNCDAHVTERYAKVFTPPDSDQPRACPHCPDMVRSGSEVREALNRE